jgi:hypothetical protein
MLREKMEEVECLRIKQAEDRERAIKAKSLI